MRMASRGRDALRDTIRMLQVLVRSLGFPPDPRKGFALKSENPMPLQAPGIHEERRFAMQFARRRRLKFTLKLGRLSLTVEIEPY